jgi:hypothetical protein
MGYLCICIQASKAFSDVVYDMNWIMAWSRSAKVPENICEWENECLSVYSSIQTLIHFQIAEFHEKCLILLVIFDIFHEIGVERAYT